MSASRHRLLCILANPPLGDGARTLARVKLATELLAFETAVVGNLFAAPSESVTAISQLGASQQGWMQARLQLAELIDSCDGVLLAYGIAAPTGTARQHHSQQLDWLNVRLAERAVPQYRVGDGSRHPSRWQRWTARAYPGLPFNEALLKSLIDVPQQTD